MGPEDLFVGIVSYSIDVQTLVHMSIGISFVFDT